MKRNSTLSLLLPCLLLPIVVFFIFSCRRTDSGIIDESPDNNSTVKQPRVMASGNQFITSDGELFKVWGMNYGGDGLLEEEWQSEEGWANYDSDFKEMNGLGANLARIHLQYNKMMNGPNQPNLSAFNNLKRAVRIAEKYDMYLLITGLGAYRKTDQPDWYNNMTDSERWATQAVFWENVARAVGKSPAIFGYDLMNEPVVAVDSTKGWLPGEGFGGLFYVQNVALHLNGQPWTEVMQNWIKTMTAAIRKADKQTMITVGFLSFPAFAAFAPDLDMMTTHLYPSSKTFDTESKQILRWQTSKPLVITEIYPMNIGADSLQLFIEQNNQHVSGWAWHYFGKTIEDYTPPQTMSDALRKIALEKFRDMSATQK